MPCDLERINALIAHTKHITEHLVRLRSTLEPTAPVYTSQHELTSTLEDLAAVARDVLRISDDPSNITLSRYGESDAARNLPPDLAPPTPTSSIVSDTSTSRKVFEPLTQTVRAVGVPLSPITPPSPVHTAIAGLGTDPTQPHGLVPRKRLPSSAGASCDGIELERDVKRHRKHEASLGKEDHSPSRAISPGQSSTDLRKLIYNIKNRDKLSRMPTFPDTDPPSTIMLRRVAAVQGGPAIRQFCSLIHTRRSRETEMGLLKFDSTGIERALELTKPLRVLTGRTTFGAFLTRLVNTTLPRQSMIPKQGDYEPTGPRSRKR